MFAIPIVIAAPFIYGLASGMGTSLVVPTTAILTLALVLGALTVWLARRVLEPAERLEQTRRILEDAYDRARAEALRDTLTGLGNHRAFQEEIERQWAIATRGGRSVALAIIDLDDFKRINDSSGHAAGDRSCRQAATTIATYVRRVRPGIPDRRRRVRARHARHRRGAGARGHPPAAGGLPRRRDRPRGEPIPSRSRPASARSRAGARDRESLYRQADAALFWSKRHGRTCVTIYDAARHEGPMAERPRGRTVRGGRPGRRDRRHPRGLPADLRPDERRAARASRVSSGRCRTAASPIRARCSRRPRRPAGPASSTSPA